MVNITQKLSDVKIKYPKDMCSMQCMNNIKDTNVIYCERMNERIDGKGLTRKESWLEKLTLTIGFVFYSLSAKYTCKKISNLINHEI